MLLATADNQATTKVKESNHPEQLTPGKALWVVSRFGEQKQQTSEYIHTHSKNRDWVAGVFNDHSSNAAVALYINGVLTEVLEPGESTNQPVYRPGDGGVAELVIRIKADAFGISTGSINM